jgi:hypothetical protein
MMFYRASPETNLENIQNDRKKLDDACAQEHDLISVYEWYQGGKLSKFEYPDAKIIDPKGKFTVTDPK